MTEILRREYIYLTYYASILFGQIAPYWLLGMILGSLVSVFGKKRLQALFAALQGTKLGLLGIVPAAVIGVASPLCMYGTIPIAASFAQKGMREDWLAAFMMCSILLNPQLIMYSAALGTPALIIRIVTCFLCGITAGLLVRLFYGKGNKTFFNFKSFAGPKDKDIDPNIVMRFLKNLLRNINATAPAFLVGITLAALFQRHVPETYIAALFGKHRGFGLLMAASVGVPLYVCGGGTIPLLLSWMQHGMSLGAASAFMITGPSMKITNLGALKVILGIKHFLLYIIFAVAFALVCGLLVDVLN